MLEISTTCALTSRDAMEIADQLREIERNGKLGQSAVARTWVASTAGGVVTTIKFTVDQDRARQQGLMRWPIPSDPVRTASGLYDADSFNTAATQ